VTFKWKIVEYIKDDESLFEKWFLSLDSVVAAKVTTALYRLEQGNFSNVKSIGKGVSEYRIDYGPGYRIYFGRSGNNIIILIGGGTKKTQNKDIKKAHLLWAEYKKSAKK
jgi:putative addiction module killer protein